MPDHYPASVTERHGTPALGYPANTQAAWNAGVGIDKMGSMNKGNTPTPGEEKMSEVIRQNFLQKACQYLLNKTGASLPKPESQKKLIC